MGRMTTQPSSVLFHLPGGIPGVCFCGSQPTGGQQLRISHPSGCRIMM
jgi:hypothetical protein